MDDIDRAKDSLQYIGRNSCRGILSTQEVVLRNGPYIGYKKVYKGHNIPRILSHFGSSDYLGKGFCKQKHAFLD